MKQLILTTILSLGLTACVVSGHPSTDPNASHVDTSSTRYDKYDRHYDYKDDTNPRKHRRIYEEMDCDNVDTGYYNDDCDEYYYVDEDDFYYTDVDNDGRYERVYYRR